MVVCVKMMSKGSKEALTVLIVTHVEKVESGVCGLCTQYRCLISLTCVKCGVRSTLCWKIGNISGSTELFAL